MAHSGRTYYSDPRTRVREHAPYGVGRTVIRPVTWTRNAHTYAFVDWQEQEEHGPMFQECVLGFTDVAYSSLQLGIAKQDLRAWLAIICDR
jgi:hypothetical protein